MPRFILDQIARTIPATKVFARGAANKFKMQDLMSLICSIRVASVALLIVGLSACQNVPIISDVASALTGTTDEKMAVSAVMPTKSPSDPILGFVASAADGENAVLTDEAAGRTVQVTAGRKYFSARGTNCRKFTTRSQSGGAVPQLACESDDGAWVRRSLLTATSNGTVRK